jgi:hypothetical protein
VEQLRWKGPTPRFDALASGLDAAVSGPLRVQPYIAGSAQEAFSTTPKINNNNVEVYAGYCFMLETRR